MFGAVDLRLEQIELTAGDRGWTAQGRAVLEGWDEAVYWEAWRGPGDPAWSVVLAPCRSGLGDCRSVFRRRRDGRSGESGPNRRMAA